MTLAMWSMLAMLALAIGTMGWAKATGPRYNNHTPREWLKKLEGRQLRAAAAHANHMESLPFFFAAVVLCTAIGLGHPEKAEMMAKVDQLAWLFVGVRVAYTAAYIADLASIRSLIWTAGVAVNVLIFIAPV